MTYNPKYHGTLPTCRYCGELGMHGTFDECLGALREALATLAPRPPRVLPPSGPKTTIFVVRRLWIGHRHANVAYVTDTLASALEWISRPKRARFWGRYYIENRAMPVGVRATINLLRQSRAVLGVKSDARAELRRWTEADVEPARITRSA